MTSQWERRESGDEDEYYCDYTDLDGIWPTEEERAYAHYRDRQEKIDPKVGIVKAPIQIRCPLEWPSCLFNLDSPEPIKHINDPSAAYKERSLPRRSGQLGSKNQKRPDIPRTNELKQRLLKRVQEIVKSPEWMSTAVFYPLGPEQLQRIKDYPFFLPAGFQWRELVNNSVAFLVVSLVQSQEFTINAIEKALRTDTINMESDEVTLSEPNAGVGMAVKYGKTPSFVIDASQSRFAVIFDEIFEESGHQSAKKYYEQKLKCKIIENRVITDPEKRWMEIKLQKFELRGRSMRMLGFSSPEERNQAMETEGIESLDIFYCDSMFNFRDIHDTVHVYVDYDLIPKNVNGIALKLKHETQKEIVETVFKEHGLHVHYFDGKHKNDESRLDTSQKTLVLQNFPRHLKRFGARLRIVEKIIELNHLQIEKIYFHEEHVESASRTNRNASSDSELLRSIEFQMYRIGHLNNIFRPIQGNWRETMNGDLGARHFLDLVREREDVPWRITRKERGPVRQKERFTIHFQDTRIGLTYIERLLSETYIGNLFSAEVNDRDGPSITPCFRRSFAVSRAIRVACNNRIHKLDASIRKTFPALSINWDPIMAVQEAEYYAARLYDEWQPGSQAGVIGVMGWNFNIIRHFYRQLEKVLAPLIYDAKGDCPSLLYGIGEHFARSLSLKYQGSLVVEVDKYNEQIKLFGDSAEEALSDLKKYKTEKSKIQYAIEIPFNFPFLNPSIKEIFYTGNVEDLRKAIGINYLLLDFKNMLLKFEGSIDSYEVLMALLEELSAEVFKMETAKRQEEIPNQTCPTCWTEISSTTDFFRFHCGHVMCRQCTNSKILNIKFTNLNVVCEQEGCGKFVAPSEIHRIILGGPNRIRDFDTVKLAPFNREVKSAIFAASQEVTNCTTADCNGVLSKSEGPIEESKQCSACSREYCRGCLSEPHPGSDCEEYRTLRQPDNSMAAYIRAAGEKNVKNCPQCSMYVEKINGCNHLECVKCRAHFCWLCLFFVKDGGSQPIYAHMTDVHGGNGLMDGLLPVDFDDADPEMQRFIHRGINQIDVFDESDDSDDDDFDLAGLPVGIRQPDIFRVVPAPPPRPIIPPPPRPEVFFELPPNIRDNVPVEDHEMYLEFLNRAPTVEQQNANMLRAIANLANNEPEQQQPEQQQPEQQQPEQQ